MQIKELVKILKRFPKDARVEIKMPDNNYNYEVTASWNAATGQWIINLTPTSNTLDVNE